MDYEIDFLKSLALTIFVETIVLLLLTKVVFKEPKNKTWIIIFAGITVSLATLPYLWFIFPLFLKSKLLYKIVSEVSAIFIESLIYFGFLRIDYRKALIISIICNSISFISGMIMNLFPL